MTPQFEQKVARAGLPYSGTPISICCNHPLTVRTERRRKNRAGVSAQDCQGFPGSRLPDAYRIVAPKTLYLPSQYVDLAKHQDECPVRAESRACHHIRL